MGRYYTHGASRADIIAMLSRGGLARSFVGNTMYQVEESKTGVRFISVYLLLRDRDGWGYKPMDESMGPCYYDCPPKLLEMVKDHPPVNDFAARWRELCWENISKKRALREKGRKNRTRLIPGARFLLYGNEYRVIRWTEDSRPRLIAGRVGTEQQYQITPKQLGELEVLTDEDLFR